MLCFLSDAIDPRLADACNFYGRLSVYDDHGGVALSQEEGRQIAQALGKDSIACILQNHG